MHCNTDEPPIVFKATLFSLSGVQPDRQKVMYKGVVIKVSYSSMYFCVLTSLLLHVYFSMFLLHIQQHHEGPATVKERSSQTSNIFVLSM